MVLNTCIYYGIHSINIIIQKISYSLKNLRTIYHIFGYTVEMTFIIYCFFQRNIYSVNKNLEKK